MGVGMGNETTWEEEVMEVGWVERGRKEGMGLSIAVRWDVGVTGMEGDGTWGRDRRLDGSWEEEGMGGGDGMYLS